MESSYYDRKVNIDEYGNPLFCTDEDKANERETAKILEKIWRCEVREYGKLCPIDFYILKEDHIRGNAELKSRSHNSDTFPTAWLNFRKWICLVMAELCTGVPSIFVVKFADNVVKYIRVRDVDARNIAMEGTTREVKSKSDKEPVIRIPLEQMIYLSRGDEEDRDIKEIETERVGS